MFQPQISDSLFAIAIFFVCLIIFNVGSKPSSQQLNSLCNQFFFKTLLKHLKLLYIFISSPFVLIFKNL